MSTIDSIHTKMQAAIETALPSYQKLSNPYNTADNADPFLRDGYGITIGGGSQSRIMAGAVTITRTFSFVLTKECFSTENDEGTRTAAHLELINDQLAVLKAFEADFSMSGSVLKIEYNSDGGIAFVQNGKDKFLELITNVSVLYLEPVT